MSSRSFRARAIRFVTRLSMLVGMLLAAGLMFAAAASAGNYTGEISGGVLVVQPDGGAAPTVPANMFVEVLGHPGPGMEYHVSLLAGSPDTITPVGANCGVSTPQRIICNGDVVNRIDVTLTDFVTGGTDDVLTLQQQIGVDAHLIGGNGNDRITGGGGINDITGGLGDDVLTGGPSLDEFIYRPGDGNDTIDAQDGDNDSFVYLSSPGTDDDVRVGTLAGLPHARFEDNAVGDSVVLGAIETVFLGLADAGVGGDLVALGQTLGASLARVNIDMADPAPQAVTVDGGSANDTWTIGSPGLGPVLAGFDYAVALIGGDFGDSITLSPGTGNDNVFVGDDVSFAGIAVNLKGGNGNDVLTAESVPGGGSATLSGDAGNDKLTGGGGDDVLVGGSGDDTYEGLGGADSLVEAGDSVGADVVALTGSGGDDALSVSRTAAGELVTSAGPITTTYSTIDAGGLFGGTAESIDKVLVAGGEGADVLTVDTANGSIDLTSSTKTTDVEYDGGADSDALELIRSVGGPSTANTYTPGPVPGAGKSDIAFGAAHQVVGFTNLEPVLDNVPGPLTISGTPASNVIDIQTASPTTSVATIDAFESIEFGAKTTLTATGLAGSDHITAATVLNGVTVGTSIDAGSGEDTLTVTGVNGVNDGANLSVTGATSGGVTSAGIPVSGANVEHLVYDGNDADGATAEVLDVTTLPTGASVVQSFPNTSGYAGSVVGPDAGRFSITSIGGASTAPTIDFKGLGTAVGSEVRLNDGGGAVDRLVVNGSGDDDAFVLVSPTTITVNSQLPLVPQGASFESASFAGGDGDDTFQIPADHGFGSGVFVQGGEPSSSDTVTFNAVAAAGPTTVNYSSSKVSQGANSTTLSSGVEHLIVNGAAEMADVSGTGNADTFRVSSIDASGALVALDGSPKRFDTTFGAIATPLVINAAAGADTLIVSAEADNDVLAIDRSTAIVTPDTGLLAIDGNDVEALTANGGTGDDTFQITGTAATPAVTLDGGPPFGSDIFELTAASITVTGGATPDAGSINDGTSTVSFAGMEHIHALGGGAGSLTVRGSNAADTISQGFGDPAFPAEPYVAVNGGAVVSYSDQTSLSLSGRDGDDAIVVTPEQAGVSSLLVDAGGPGASDVLTVSGLAGSGDGWVVDPSGQGAGTVSNPAIPTVPVSFTNTETLKVVGQLVDADKVGVEGTLGDDQFEYLPGVTPDVGVIVGSMDQAGLPFPLVRVEFSGMDQVTPGLFDAQNVATFGGLDSLVYNGFDRPDAITVSETATIVSPSGVNLVNVSNGLTYANVTVGAIDKIFVRAKSGNDAVTGVGNIPTPVEVDGGEASPGSDTFTFDTFAPANLTTVDYAVGTVQEAGFAAYSLVGVEHAVVNTGGGALDINGTTGNDAFAATPSGASSAIVSRTGSAFDTTGNVGGGVLSLAGLGGTDAVAVNATAGDDAIAASDTAVAIAGLQSLTLSGFESIGVNGLAGNDQTTVTPSLTTSFDTIAGGAPIGGAGGDSLIINAIGAVTHNAGPTGDSGSYAVGANKPVSYTGIEGITIAGASAVTVNGSNAINDNFVVVATASGVPVANDGTQDFTIAANSGPSVQYIDVPQINLNGVGGDDTFTIDAPAPGAPVNWNVAVVVDGGPSTAGDVVTLSTPNAAAESVTYDPAAGTLDVVGADTTLITLATVERVAYVGGGDNDTLTTTGSGTFVHTAGSGSGIDEGTIRLNTTPTLAYSNLGPTATVAVTGAGGTDKLVYGGSASGDVFDINATSSTLTTPAGVHLPVTTTGIESSSFDGFDGDDVFNVAAGTPGVTIEGGNPSASDVINYPASANATVTYGAVGSIAQGANTTNFTGIEVLNVAFTANTLDLLVIGSAGPDEFSYEPTGVDDGTIVRTNSASPSSFQNFRTNVSNVGGARLDALAGADKAVLIGQNDASDAIAIVRSSVTHSTLQVDLMQPLAITTALGASTTESVEAKGRDGSDAFDVSGLGGPSLVLDGGDPPFSGSDSFAISDSDITVTGGPLLNEATVTDSGGIVTVLRGLEHIHAIGVGGADSLRVLGTTGPDTISQGFGDSAFPTDPFVVVNTGAVISYSGTESLSLSGRDGDDAIVVTPEQAGVSSLLVDAGGPGASDVLTVSGLAGSGDGWVVDPSGQGAGTVSNPAIPTVPVSFTNTETLKVVGQLVDADKVGVEGTLGDDQFEYLPGVTPDVGVIVGSMDQAGLPFPLVRVEFSGMDQVTPGLFDAQNVATFGGLDSLVYNGFDRPDAITVSETATIVSPSGVNLVNVSNGLTYANVTVGAIDKIFVRAKSGNDAVTGVGNIPTPVEVDGGEASPGSDTFTFDTFAPANLTTVDYAVGTVQEAGFAAYSLVGVEHAVVNTGGGALDINGTTGDDRSTATPSSANAGSFALLGASPLTTFSAVSTFSVNSLAGSDALTVVGTAGAETITATEPVITVGSLIPVNQTGAEDLRINAGSGADRIDVTAHATVPFSVDGGDPAGINGASADTLNVIGGAATYIAGEEPDSGAVATTGNQLVSFDHIENLILGGGGAPLAFGTNGDDTFTITARNAAYGVGLDGVQDFTISVNNGPDILYTNQPSYGFDALSGFDKMVVVAPAQTPPANAGDWDVDLTLSGGSGRDQVRIETPGATAIDWTPSSPSSGVFLLDETTNDSQFDISNTEELAYDGKSDGTFSDAIRVLGSAPTAGNNAYGYEAATGLPFFGTGTSLDEGRLRIDQTLALSYIAVGPLNNVSFIDGDNLTDLDRLVYGGSLSDDQFIVAATGAVTLTTPGGTRRAVGQTFIESTALDGLDGDDTFTVNGSIPASLLVTGGNPSSGSDTLILNNPAATAVVDYQSRSVTGFGAPVTFGGIEHIRPDLGSSGFGLDVRGTNAAAPASGQDTFTYVPGTPTSGTITRLGDEAQVDFTGVLAANPLRIQGGSPPAPASDGFDEIVVLGTTGSDTISTTATTITAITPSGATHPLTVDVKATSGIDQLKIATGDGDDAMTLALNLTGITKIFDGGAGNDNIDGSALGADPLFLGGTGNDVIVGSPFADFIDGGDNNDTLTGGGGNDAVFGAAGSDIINWTVGDGSDVLEGGAGEADILNYTGVAGSDAVAIAPAGARLTVTRAAELLDGASLEDLRFSLDAGVDAFSVGDLFETGVQKISADLGSLDGATDVLSVSGRQTPDSIQTVLAGAGVVAVQGLTYDVTFTSVSMDTLSIDGLGGADSLSAEVALAPTVDLTQNGGAGDDTITGPGTLNGDGDNDTLRPNGSSTTDLADGGSGDDSVYFDAGVNAVDGGPGFDRIVVVGQGDTDSIVTGNVAGPALRINNDGTIGDYSLTGDVPLATEQLLIQSLGGSDTVTLNHVGIGGAGLATRVEAGDGNDTVTGSAAAFAPQLTLFGGQGDDSLTGGSNVDRVEGDDGNDILAGGGAADSLFGGAGADRFVWNAATDLPDVVEGGSGDSDEITVTGGAAADTLLVTPVGMRVRMNYNAAIVNQDVSEVENLIFNLAAAADTLNIGDLFNTHTRKVTADLTGSTTASDAAADSIVVAGRNVADSIQVSALAAVPPATLPGVDVLGLTYDIRINNTVPGVGNDTLTVNGNDGDDDIKATAGVENNINIVFNGGNGNDTLSGDAVLSGGVGDDTLIGTSGNDTLNGDAGNDNIHGNGGTDVVTGGADNDSIYVPGTDGNDAISVSQAGSVVTTVINNGSSTTTTIYSSITSVERAYATGLAADDSLTVNGPVTAFSQGIDFDGGFGRDKLVLTGTGATSDTYTAGPALGSGLSSIVFPSGTQVVDFDNLEPVQDLVASAIQTVNANASANSITFGAGPGGAPFAGGSTTGLVAIDSLESFEFVAKAQLRINGAAGNDTISLNPVVVNDNGPAADLTTDCVGGANVTAICVDGGTGTDNVTYNGRANTADALTFDPKAVNAGDILDGSFPDVALTTVDALLFRGLNSAPGASDTLTIDTVDYDGLMTLTPGAAADSGAIAFTLGGFTTVNGIPTAFESLGGSNATLSFIDSATSGRPDKLRYLGTANNNTFTVTPTAGGLINQDARLNVEIPSVNELLIDALDGNDTVNAITGPYDFAMTIDGNNPDNADSLNLGGPILVPAPVSVVTDLAAKTVTGFTTTGTVTFSGLQFLDVNAGANDYTVRGTSGPDSLIYAPTDISNGTVTRDGQTLQDLGGFANTFATTGLFTIDGTSTTDVDTVRVLGQNDADTLTINRTLGDVQVDALKTVRIAKATTEAVIVDGGLGDDVFSASGANGWKSLLLNGGSPPGSDSLLLDVSGGVFADLIPGAHYNEGVVNIRPAPAPATPTESIPFYEIEHVRLTGFTLPPGPGAGSPALAVCGTPGDDRFTQDVTAGPANIVTTSFGPAAVFTGFPTLTLCGLGGNDEFSTKPNVLVGVTTFNVQGDDPSSVGNDKVFVTGTTAQNNVVFAPTAPGAATFAVDASTPVTMTGTENVSYAGAGGDDSITTRTPAGAHDVTLEPGGSADSGRIVVADDAPLVPPAPPSGLNTFVGLDFQNAGIFGSLTFINNGGGRVDSLSFNGTKGKDSFSVDSTDTIELTSGLLTYLRVKTPGVNILELDGGLNDDEFFVEGLLPYLTTIINGDVPDRSDTLNLSNASSAVTVDFNAGTVVGYGGTVSYVGIEHLITDVTTQALTVLGTPKADTMRFEPQGATSGTVTIDNKNTTLDFDGAPSTFTINPVVGTDKVEVVGTVNADTINVVRGATTTVTVVGKVPVNLPLSAIPDANETVNILGREGSDRFVVTGTGLASGLPVLGVEGGEPSSTTDTLEVSNDFPTVNYAVGGDTNGGVLVTDSDATPGNGNTGPINFTSTEVINLKAVVGAGRATVIATDGVDAITQTANKITVNNGTVVNVGGGIAGPDFGNLSLNGANGDDQVTLSPLTLTEAAAIAVLASDPVASDDLQIQGSNGLNAFTFTPTAGQADAATIAVDAAPVTTVDGIEKVIIDGRGGSDIMNVVTPAGAQTVNFRPATTGDPVTVAVDSSSVRVNSLVPMWFQNLGTAGFVNVNDAVAARSDTLVYTGTPVNDVFRIPAIGGNPDSIQLQDSVAANRQLVVEGNGVGSVVLNSIEGDDDFVFSAVLPFTVQANGGDPTHSDSLTATGALGAVTTNFTTRTITGYGGVISFSGIEELNTQQNGTENADLNIIGTAAPESICYDPLAPDAGRLFFVGAAGGGSFSDICLPDQRATNILYNFSGVDPFFTAPNGAQDGLTVDPAGGLDEIIVNGTVSKDWIRVFLTVPYASVQVDPNYQTEAPPAFLTLMALQAATEKLVIASDNGSDTIDVINFGVGSPLVFIDGENPATKREADHLRACNAGPKAKVKHLRSRVPYSGSVITTYSAPTRSERIDYANVEKVTLCKGIPAPLTKIPA